MYKRRKVIAATAGAHAMLPALLAGTLVLAGCASQKPQISATQYRFAHEGETYRIRSLAFAERSEARNELIGASFLAVDYDQDRILDCILMGEASLTDAQAIYEHGLKRLAEESKLQLRNPSIHRYVREDDGLRYEISSFRPPTTPPFNQFKVIQKRWLVPGEIVVGIDQNADGELEMVVKGAVALAEIQQQYAAMIDAGLQKGDMIKSNGAILVREK